MSAGRWSAALDQFAACLADQERQLAERHPELVVPFAPPAGLGPLPPELGERARALLARSEALAAQVHEALDATRRQLLLARRMTTERAAVPAYVDSHA
jgi:hypothetical protein